MSVSDNSARNADLLTRLLPQVADTASFQLGGDWCAAAPACGLPGMYVVDHGRAWFDGGRQAGWLEAGDIVLMAATVAHRLASERAVEPSAVNTSLCDGIHRDGWWHVGVARRLTRLHALKLGSRRLPFLPGVAPCRVLARAEQPRPVRHIVAALITELQPGRGSDAVVRSLTHALWLLLLRTQLDDRRLDLAMLEVIDEARGQLEDLHGVEDLSRLAGLSRSRFSERFRACTGEAPMRWLRRAQMQRAQHLLVEHHLSVAEVAERLGYGSESAFRKAYWRVLGVRARQR